jgi:hypothetical protein
VITRKKCREKRNKKEELTDFVGDALLLEVNTYTYRHVLLR